MLQINELRSLLERRQGQRQQLEETLEKERMLVRAKKKELKQHEYAREIIREVGIKTQQQLEYHIEDVVSLALDAVLDDPYELGVQFIQRRNQSECDLFFSRAGKRLDSPVDSAGIGAIDVAAFALRVCSWSMQRPRSRNTIIMDEPMRFLSKDNLEKASRMIKELSKRLGLQFIIITHEQDLATYADKVFSVTKQAKKPSKVKEL